MKKTITFLFIGLCSMLIFQSCGSGEIKSNEDSQASQNKEPVFIPWICEDAYVETGESIALYYEWQTMTKDLNVEYFDATKHYVMVDGIPVEIKVQGNGDLVQLGDGTFKQMFWMNIGPLKPGDHEIESVAEITEPVFDGWDWYGPDTDYTSFRNLCTLTVGDEPPAAMAQGGQVQPPAVEEQEPEVPAPLFDTCPISTTIRPNWDTYLCETFDTTTSLWTGLDQGTELRMESGEFLIDNSTKVASGYTTGFIYPVPLGQGSNHMISVDGRIESKFKSNTWGVYIRSKMDEIVYFFMIDKSGAYSLTGSTENEANRYLGNIKSSTHNAIKWDSTNNITAVADGRQLEFYINDKLIITHEAINAVDPIFGLIVWGGEGVSAVTHLDNLLVKTN